MKEASYFNFNPSKQKLIFLFTIGILLILIGLVLTSTNTPHNTLENTLENVHETNLMKRLFSALWFNNVFFTGISAIGVVFVAIHYAAQAGWSTLIKRIPETFGYALPWTGGIAIVLFVLSHHDIFHWTHNNLYAETLANGDPNPSYDSILDGKRSYLNTPFYLIRMIAFYAIWYALFALIRRHSLAEDLEVGNFRRKQMIRLSAIFLIIFALTSAVASWDWLMSIDPHWFSTMFGWYVFASWFVTGIAFITLIVVRLKAL